MTGANSITTPMVRGLVISAHKGEAFVDTRQYQRTVGLLQYITISRPPIIYNANKVCQFIHDPTNFHWQAVKRMLRYLGGTIDHGLLFYKLAELNVWLC